MKIASLAAGCLCVVFFSGCCCDDCKEDKQASLGAVSTENCSKSCSDKAAACSAEKGSMGAVGESKSGCCAAKAAAEKAAH